MPLTENFETNDPLPAENEEHSVIVHFFNYWHDELDPLHELEEQLRETIDAAGVGRHDGHEIAMEGADGTLYMYGPNAEALFKTVLPILQQAPFMKGAIASLRFGPWNKEANEIEIEL
jgi:hypothetical protein